MKAFDVAIVGAGVMGCATARALAVRGLSVIVFEQFELGHKRGSSHGCSRIFRLSYPDPVFVGMALEALVLWRRLERDLDRRLVRTTGGIDAGTTIRDNAAALRRQGVAHELISGTEAMRRFPSMRLPANDEFLVQQDAGIVAADEALASFARDAVARGAEVRERARVTVLDPVPDGVVVHHNGSRAHAGAVVVAAGAWARPLLATAGMELAVRPTRETVAYFHLDAAVPTLVEWGEPSVYALPSPGQGIKLGEHIAGPTTDPDQAGAVNQESVARLRAWVGERFPAADPVPHLTETCLYTNTADERFVLRRQGPIVVGSPCSGHGFKFAPLIGERLADLVTGPATSGDQTSGATRGSRRPS